MAPDFMHKKHILIVEDEKDILLSLQEFLELSGYEVETAGNGEEAMKTLDKEHLPDLILLDMKMPVMNGWQFAEAFRDSYDHQSKVLVMTAAADAENRAKEINANGWVGKPFDLDELLKKIKGLTRE
jgi:DNA-binding response OmpR family regulator